VQSALLKNLYAKVTDLQITPDATTGTPAAIYGVPDTIEVNSAGIPGGFQQARLANATLNAAVGWFTFPTFTWGGSATLEFIMRQASPGGASLFIPFDIPVDASTAQYRLVFTDPSQGSIVRMVTATTGVFTLNGVQVVRPQLDRAVRVTVVIVGTTASLYYNGVLVGTATVSAFNNTVARTGFIGAITGSTAYCTGYLYDFRLWNVARTQQQIADNAFVRVDPATPGLLAYWKMDGTPNDATTAGRNLAANGTVTYRPVNGFDVYAFNNAGARVAANMRWRFSGA
jgi:Concanavalin A-like lectin/glucanases superfamily